MTNPISLDEISEKFEETVLIELRNRGITKQPTLSDIFEGGMVSTIFHRVGNAVFAHTQSLLAQQTRSAALDPTVTNDVLASKIAEDLASNVESADSINLNGDSEDDVNMVDLKDLLAPIVSLAIKQCIADVEKNLSINAAERPYVRWVDYSTRTTGAGALPGASAGVTR